MEPKEDVEAQLRKDTTVTDTADVDVSNVEEIHAKELQSRSRILRSMRKGEEWLDEKLGGIETRGIDRIPEAEKQPPSILNIFLMWWSLNVHVGVVPLGVLGPEFGLSLNQSVAASVVGTLLGTLCTAYTGTLGPKVSIVLSNWRPQE